MDFQLRVYKALEVYLIYSVIGMRMRSKSTSHIDGPVMTTTSWRIARLSHRLNESLRDRLVKRSTKAVNRSVNVIKYSIALILWERKLIPEFIT
ncbi:hypothetical protein J5U23_01386 [Saccharolobus shibatae B12]|uniref:Uncharacterized protein n=1 Tax=Saccharolobus shibatae (strain ATCC 51178 / DSM 5389 / JCM 8931 / NBRC 15437 / B12) TaxID=523848 RepID=A0A8F5GTM1_SACSH|nr:hypothetical protein J5U23_01386 [Saccharolobus shibatae B12]